MTAKRLGGLRGLLSALVLVVGGAVLAWLCVRSAAVRALPITSSVRASVAGDHHDTVLADATSALIERRGAMLPPAMLAEVRGAAQAAPLDARPFLILGRKQLLDGDLQRGIKTLEASQRLDPRNRLTHLLLLESYLEARRYSDVAAQFAIATRLVGQAQGPIAAALAQMINTPEMAMAARAALRADPALERLVLNRLARSDADPATLFALASPAAKRDAGASGNWGQVLISRMVAEGGYVTARSVWQQVHRLPAAAIAAPVYDGGFRGLPGSPPFNWTLIAGTLGTADIDNGSLLINYYGRDTGALASQLLVLAPGAYEISVAVEGSKTGEGPSLDWSLRCDTDEKDELVNLPVIAIGERRRVAARFTVPSGCPAQQLVLAGNAGEFPAPINITLRDLRIRKAQGTTR
jgi:hypothetical protein